MLTSRRMSAPEGQSRSTATAAAGLLRRAWLDYCASFDPLRAALGVKPAALFGFAAFGLAVLLTMALVPGARRLTGLTHGPALIGLFLLGVALDLACYILSSRGRHDLGMPPAFMAMAVYTSFTTSVMVNTTAPTRYIWGLLFGQIATDYGRRFSFSWLMFGAVVVLPMGIVLLEWRDFALVVLVAFGAMMFVFTSVTTGSQRRLERQQAGWRRAFEAADEVASSRRDHALAASLAEIGGFAHNLCNALVPVTQNLKFLRQETELDGEPLAALLAAHRSAQRCSELVEQLVARARGSAPPAAKSFWLARPLEQVMEAEIANRRPVRLSSPLPTFEVRGNPDHLRLVLENLVANAFHAGASEVRIAARVEAGGAAIHLLVEDDGPGIPESLQGRLFEAPLAEGTSAGHGFGLYISRRLLELLGGQLSMVSTGKRGTAFDILLPGQIALADAERASS